MGRVELGQPKVADGVASEGPYFCIKKCQLGNSELWTSASECRNAVVVTCGEVG